MKLRVITMTKQFNGTVVDQVEEVIEGESQKPINKSSARRLLTRRYPSRRISIVDSFEEPFKWCASIENVDQNLWQYTYATPLD